MSRLLFGLGAAVAVVALSALAAPDASPTAYCRRVGTDDLQRPLPATLAPEARRLFGLNAPDSTIAKTSVYRCARSRVLICTVGANLNCGKADTRRRLAAADDYCRANSGSNSIPMVVTGHETIYSWRCRGSRAMTGPPMQSVDERGFVAALWKRAG